MASVDTYELYNVAAVTSDDLLGAAGTTVELEPSMCDYIFWLFATYNSGSSTLDVTIQHSPDGVTWIDVDSFTQVTTASANHEMQPASATTSLAKYVRASINVGAGSPNYDVVVKMSVCRKWR